MTTDLNAIFQMTDEDWEMFWAECYEEGILEHE